MIDFLLKDVIASINNTSFRQYPKVEEIASEPKSRVDWSSGEPNYYDDWFDDDGGDDWFNKEDVEEDCGCETTPEVTPEENFINDPVELKKQQEWEAFMTDVQTITKSLFNIDVSTENR